jgi:CMP-N-acetylneuraminic acid synthetase
MKIVALVPARSGSKGFPHKNVARLGGKSLVELAVKVGLDCDSVQSVYISTDSMAYETLAIQAGAQSLGLRPRDLASDTAKSVDVALDFLKRLAEPADCLVLLQPTSPMRHPEDISKMIEILKNQKADAVVSVEKLEEPHPNKLKKITSDGFIAPFLGQTSSEVPRQSLPEVFKLNGALYVIRTDVLVSVRTFLPQKTLPFLMKGTINIDSEQDYQIIQGLLKTNNIQIYGV